MLNTKEHHAQAFGFKRGHYDEVSDEGKRSMHDHSLTAKNFLCSKHNCLCKDTQSPVLNNHSVHAKENVMKINSMAIPNLQQQLHQEAMKKIRRFI